MEIAAELHSLMVSTLVLKWPLVRDGIRGESQGPWHSRLLCEARATCLPDTAGRRSGWRTLVEVDSSD